MSLLIKHVKDIYRLKGGEGAIIKHLQNISFDISMIEAGLTDPYQRLIPNAIREQMRFLFRKVDEYIQIDY